MAELASLKIAVETGNLKKATSELKKLENAGQKAERGTDNLTKSSKKLGTSFFTLQTAVIAVVGSMAVSKLIKYADAMTLVDSKLKLVTDSTEELTDTQKKLFEIAQKTRSEFTSTVDLYSRIARSTKDYNIEQEELLGLTDTINKAMIISGGTAESMNAAVIQLGQAFSADFQSVGQELASIREQTPRLYEAMLKGTNLSTKAFKKQAEEGKLSSIIIIDALKSQGVAVADEFGLVNMTVDQSMQVMDNSMTKAIGSLDKMTGFSTTLANAFLNISEAMDKVTESSNTMTNAEKITKSFEIVDEIEEATKQLQAYSAAKDRLEKGSDYFGKDLATAWKLVDSTEELNEKIAEQQLKINNLANAYSELNKVKKEGLDPNSLSTESGETADLQIERDLDNFDVDIDFAIAQNKAIYDDKLEKFKNFADERQKYWDKQLKEDEKASEKMWDNIGDIAKSNISGALQSGLDGDLDLSAFTAQLSKAVGQAMLFSGGWGSVAGVGLMGIGALLGNKKASPSIDYEQVNFDKFIDGLDKASDALNQFGNTGTSISDSIATLQSKITETYNEFYNSEFSEYTSEEDKKYLFETYSKKYKDELSRIVTSSLADTLDLTALSTSQLESLASNIDIEAMKAMDAELNNIALAMKLGTDTAEDSARATEILSDTEFAYYKDMGEAIDILSTKTEDAIEAEEALAESRLSATRAIDDAMLSSLSYLTELEKLTYANNLYRDAITQEDKVSSSRTLAEISKGTTRTKEDYVPVFAQYLNELKKQGEEATLTDVVNELIIVGEKIDESAELSAEAIKYA